MSLILEKCCGGKFHFLLSSLVSNEFALYMYSTNQSNYYGDLASSCFHFASFTIHIPSLRSNRLSFLQIFEADSRKK